MILDVLGVVLLIVAFIFLLYAVQIHGWLNPRHPEMNEEQKRLNRKFYLQAYGISTFLFLIGFLCLRPWE
ncbi:hypothetical protein [Paenibacillus prosopidis]|uniref:Uncharacterized protein n=1 Tax=Paenibacillus prosopidis TaxID=630520 RepID=A0A368VLD3_9BACL|nr:hypothetical protein [Paenibacillus prosopidis]RCW41679.1 hypothetical protein DFP97_122115 [Paenibacillus prosopidis]